MIILMSFAIPNRYIDFIISLISISCNQIQCRAILKLSLYILYEYWLKVTIFQIYE